jgi:hypothetical protein
MHQPEAYIGGAADLFDRGGSGRGDVINYGIFERHDSASCSTHHCSAASSLAKILVADLLVRVGVDRSFELQARVFMGHQTELFAHGRDGITNLADYANKFAAADIKLVRPVIRLPGVGQTDEASLLRV